MSNNDLSEYIIFGNASGSGSSISANGVGNTTITVPQVDGYTPCVWINTSTSDGHLVCVAGGGVISSGATSFNVIIHNTHIVALTPTSSAVIMYKKNISN